LLGMIQIIYKIINNIRSQVDRKYASIAVGGLTIYLITLFTDNTFNYVTEFGNYIYAFVGIAVAQNKYRWKGNIPIR